MSLLFATAALAQPRYVVLVSLDGFAAYHLQNSGLDLPNIRALAERGVWADKGSETVFPTVTHPSHTTMITGVFPRKHGILANELFIRGTGQSLPENTLLRSEAILAKTVFDTAKQKGLTTAAFMWPETVEDPAIDYNLVTRSNPVKRQRALVKNKFVEELSNDGLPMQMYDLLRSEGGLGLVSDTMTTLAACHTIRKHKPNLIAIHLTNTDHEQHDRGPNHPLAQASLTKADYNVGQIVRAIKEAGIWEQTVIIVGADHGFTSVYDEINIRPYFAEAGLEDKVQFQAFASAPFIRLSPTFDPKTDQPKLDNVFNRLRKDLHIIRIYRSEEFPEAVQLPRFEDSDRVRGQYLIVGDEEVYLVWKPDNDTSRRKLRRPAHGHGFMPFHPSMYPMLVMAGDGIRKGVQIGHVHNADIAPTITRILDLPLLEFDGKVMQNALNP